MASTTVSEVLPGEFLATWLPPLIQVFGSDLGRRTTPTAAGQIPGHAPAETLGSPNGILRGGNPRHRKI